MFKILNHDIQIMRLNSVIAPLVAAKAAECSGNARLIFAAVIALDFDKSLLSLLCQNGHYRQ